MIVGGYHEDIMSKSMIETSSRDKSARSTARSGSAKRSSSADAKKAESGDAAAAAPHKPAARSGYVML